jgi:polysaccharide deacetylase family protein (PEP-CTERM system associated)
LSEKPKIILTVDVEDNFTREELVHAADWDHYEKQVIVNTRRAISLLRELNGDATFFVLGKVAERHPAIVRNIADAGYEVASHGYAHELTDKLSPDEFRTDIRRSLDILQGITQKEIHGFRARSFSITRNTLWALSALEQMGIIYDSSMTDAELSAITGRSPEAPREILHHKIIELPISTRPIFGKNVAISGGIVFRLVPYLFYKALLKDFESSSHHPVVYCHVWEFNKDQPKRRVSPLQKLAQGSWTYTTEAKIRKLSENYSFISAQRYLEHRKSTATISDSSKCT